MKAELLPQKSHFATPQKTRKSINIFPCVIFNGCLIVFNFNIPSAEPPSPALASRCPSAHLQLLQDGTGFSLMQLTAHPVLAF